MLDAMKAVQDGSPITTAARVHGVPRTSLYNRIKGRVIHGVKPGPKQYLSTEEETELAEFAIEAASVGCGQTRKQIMIIAENVAKDKGTLQKDRISAGWYDKFMKRRAYLSLRKGDPANDRMDAVTSQGIKHYFDLLEKTLKDNNLLNKPAQIYNVDETGMAYEHRPPKVVTLKGQKKVKSRTSGNKAQTTVVACVNAIGQAIPPYVIYNAKTLNPEWMKDGPPGTKYARSENGWIDTDLFEHWFINHFLTHAVSSRPLLLILDGHKTHYQLHVCQEARKQEVIIFCLPPHSTHVSQPLDTCVFKPLKTEWNKAMHILQSKNPGAQITKYNFPRLLKEAWENAMLSKNICSGFRNAGIYPINRDKVRPTIENDELLTDSDSDESSNHGDVVDDDDNPSCDNSDVEACSDEHLENEELFNKRYEEGYNIYSESYAKWLLKHDPRETPTDWITRLEQGVTKSKGPKNSSVHSDSLMVPHGSQQSNITLEEEGDANEQLYQKRFEEGYDIYDEGYVKWLMANHPNNVPSEWLTEASSSSMISATTTASQPDKSTKSDKIALNQRKRLRAYDTKPGGPKNTGNNVSKYLRAIDKQTGGREKKKAEKTTVTKKDTGLKKMPIEEAFVKSTNEKTRKGKGKATVKDTRDLDTCPICMEMFEKVRYDMGDWIECHCKQWIHEDCINYNFVEPFICPKCV